MFLRFFTSVTIVLTVILALAQADVRVLGQLEGLSSFDGTPIVDAIYSFGSGEEATATVQWIVRHVGAPAKFTIESANVPDAVATVVEEERLILYNRQFIQRIKQDANTDWAATAIVAHEIGHHISGHTLGSGGSKPHLELEADYFAGFTLTKMGASLEQAQAAFETLPNTNAPSHPPKSARLAAVADGYYESKEISEGDSSTGILNVNSTPSRASVYIDGEYIGNTPLNNHVLEKGNHSLQLNLAGHEDFNGSVSVIAGQNIERDFTLTATTVSTPDPLSPPPISLAVKPTTGTLNIISDPSGTSVYIAGEYKGKTPLDNIEVSVGNHEVRLEQEGYEEEKQLISVSSGENKQFRVSLSAV